MQKSLRPKHPRQQLLEGQSSELTILDRDGKNRRVIYETGNLIEAPNWTLDGKWLIFNSDGRLFKISPDGTSGPHKINTAPIENLNNDHCLSPDGKTIFVSANDGHLYAVSLSGGTPQKISNDQDPARQFSYYLHGVSPSGDMLTYVGLEKTQEGQTQTRICTIPSGGGEDAVLTDGACPVDGSEYSPDGKWIYFNSEAGAIQAGHAQIFKMNLDGEQTSQLTDDERVNWFPHVSPDGTIIVYISFPAGTLGHPSNKDVQIKTMNLDGSNQTIIDRFFGGQGTINVNSWAPDSARFAYVTYPMEE